MVATRALGTYCYGYTLEVAESAYVAVASHEYLQMLAKERYPRSEVGELSIASNALIDIVSDIVLHDRNINLALLHALEAINTAIRWGDLYSNLTLTGFSNYLFDNVSQFTIDTSRASGT